MTEPQWEPANEAERNMLLAIRADNRQEYFRLLTVSKLYLPILPTPDGAEPTDVQEFATAEIMGRTYLVAYTSAELLRAAVGDGATGALVVYYSELAEKWPVRDWQLAVNPGLILDCYLPIASVREAAEGRLAIPTAVEAAEVAATDPEVRADVEATQRALAEAESAEAAGQPAGGDPAGTVPGGAAALNEVEEVLGAALDSGDREEYVAALLRAVVLVPTAWPVLFPERIHEPGFPWRPATGLESPTIEVFTAGERLDASYPSDTPRIQVPLVEALMNWPDPGYALAVNPGGPFELRLAGEALRQLVELVEDETEAELRNAEAEGALQPKGDAPA